MRRLRMLISIVGVLVIVLVGFGCSSVLDVFVPIKALAFESSGVVSVSGNVMAVFYESVGERVGFWSAECTIVDDGDVWNVKADIGYSAVGVSKAVFSYGLFKYVDLGEIGNNVTLSDLELEVVEVDDLPNEEHIGKIVEVDTSRVKLLRVERKYYGVTYSFWCLVTQSVKELYQLGEVEIGDYVLVSFIEEMPNGVERNVAIVTDKIFVSW